MSLDLLNTSSVYQPKYGSVELQKQVKVSNTMDEIKIRRKHRKIKKAKTTAGDILKIGAITGTIAFAIKNPQKAGKLLGSALYCAKKAVGVGAGFLINTVKAGAGALKTVISKAPSFVSNLVKHTK